MKIIALLTLSYCLTPTLSHAHGDHGVPGALPPPLHGGVIQEVEHKESKTHTHEGAEAELFMEAKYDNKTLQIFPLSLKAGDASTFLAVSPKKDLSKINIKIVDPRKKIKDQELKLTIGDDSVVAPFDAKGMTRFFVYVSFLHGTENKFAKVQIVNN